MELGAPWIADRHSTVQPLDRLPDQGKADTTSMGSPRVVLGGLGAVPVLQHVIDRTRIDTGPGIPNGKSNTGRTGFYVQFHLSGHLTARCSINGIVQEVSQNRHE